ncbi:hypothetical protein J6590_084982 [Homalodisca vitripennis]|nr:hypothetical protein J6590_084982 [Homalodisca vitripennis]
MKTTQQRESNGRRTDVTLVLGEPVLPQGTKAQRRLVLSWFYLGGGGGGGNWPTRWIFCLSPIERLVRKTLLSRCGIARDLASWVG